MNDTWVYIERMVGTSSMVRCERCGKMIRWPEEARFYAPTLADTPQIIEHVEHDVRFGTKHG